jgi:hypothetical protein
MVYPGWFFTFWLAEFEVLEDSDETDDKLWVCPIIYVRDRL